MFNYKESVEGCKLTAIINESDNRNLGISKRKARMTIEELEEQILLIDQKLKVNINREVWGHFQTEIKQIDHTKEAIKKLKFNSK